MPPVCIFLRISLELLPVALLSLSAMVTTTAILKNSLYVESSGFGFDSLSKLPCAVPQGKANSSWVIFKYCLSPIFPRLFVKVFIDAIYLTCRPHLHSHSFPVLVMGGNNNALAIGHSLCHLRHFCHAVLLCQPFLSRKTTVQVIN